MNILFCDDNIDILEEYKNIIKSQGAGYQCKTASSIKDFKDIDPHGIDIAFVDWSLGDGFGSDIIDNLIDGTKVYIVTADPNSFDCWMYAEDWHIKIIEKPFRVETIIRAIRGEL